VQHVSHHLSGFGLSAFSAGIWLDRLRAQIGVDCVDNCGRLTPGCVSRVSKSGKVHRSGKAAKRAAYSTAQIPHSTRESARDIRDGTGKGPRDVSDGTADRTAKVRARARDR
jgi:hypothetical protein